MDELLTFLNARFDEDEQTVRDSGDTHPFPGDHMLRIWDDIDDPATVVINGAHVLREIAAKRQILDEHAPCTVMVMSGDGKGYPGIYCGCCSPSNPSKRQRFPCRTVRLLAQPYIGENGYKQEWKV